MVILNMALPSRHVGEMSPVATKATFSCAEWSFLNIYITDILLAVATYVAMWRPFAYLWTLSLLGRRRRRWAKGGPTLGQRLVSAG